jgi:N utilization substance protein B
MTSQITLRKKARQLAVQGLYQWQMADDTPTNVQAQILSHTDTARFDIEYFNEVFLGAVAEKTELEKLIVSHSSRALKDISPIEQAILLLASFELQNRLDIPYKVVINEALSLSKEFGANEAYKFVNGVLDKIARDIRTDE